MDTDRVATVVREFARLPSRRAVARALVGLFAGSLLAPHLGMGDAAAGNTHNHKHGGKRHRHKQPSTKCPRSFAHCSAGDFSGCCNTATDPGSGDPVEVCTECGCCQTGSSKCCPGRDYGLCCPSDLKCCYSNDFSEIGCCEQADTCCGPGCCYKDQECCQTTENGQPSYYCCPRGACGPAGGPGICA